MKKDLSELKDVAKAYVRAVQLEEEARNEGSPLAPKAAELRDQLLEEFLAAAKCYKGPALKREDAARIAFELANNVDDN